MTKEIIDRLEAIEINQEQRTALLRRQGAGEIMEVFKEATAIGQAGQRIVAREPARLLLGPLPLRHLLPQIAYAPVAIDDGGQAKAKQKRQELFQLVGRMFEGPVEHDVEGISGDNEGVERD